MSVIFPVAAYTTGQGESLNRFYKSTSVYRRDFSPDVTLIENLTLPDADLTRFLIHPYGFVELVSVETSQNLHFRYYKNVKKNKHTC